MAYIEVGDAYCMVKDCTQPWAFELEVEGTGSIALCRPHHEQFAGHWEVPVIVTRAP